jgi:quercetin dioxygenase-like cupin family protein
MSTSPTATVRPAAAVPATEIKAGTDAAVQVLVGPQQGETSYVLRRFIFGEGGGMPMHTNLVEHQQYVLRGRAKITIADAVHEVSADDTLFIPALMPHSYEVIEGPFEFICVVPDKPDQVTLVDAR